MIRNLNDPNFQNVDQYSVTIPYNQAGGIISTVIEATDADTYVSLKRMDTLKKGYNLGHAVCLPLHSREILFPL